MTIIAATVGKNPLEEMESPSQLIKESEIHYLGATSKMTEWSVCFQGKPFNITVSCLCPKHWCRRSRSWLGLWWPTTSSRTKTKNGVLFIIGDWNAKAGSQEIPGITDKFDLGVQNEAGQRLTEFLRKSLKKWEYQTTLSVPWETCMHVKKQH